MPPLVELFACAGSIPRRRTWLATVSLAILAGCSLVAAAAQDTASSGGNSKITIAVNDLAASGVSRGEADIIGDRVRAELVGTQLFRVLERAEMKQILQEQGFQQSDVCDKECVVRAGQLLGVQRMVTGTVGRIGGSATISLRMISVETGEILYIVNEDCDCKIEYVATLTSRKVALKLAKLVKGEVAKREESAKGMEATPGTLVAETVPTGAKIYLNEKESGVTPYRNFNLKSDFYACRVEKPTYSDITEYIYIGSGERLTLSFNLIHTKQYLDSVNAERLREKKQHQWFRRITFGGIGLIGLVAGIGMDYLAQEQVDKQKAYSREYQTATSGFNDIVAANQAARDKANTFMNYRNIFYGLAALGGIGLAISIPF